MPASAAASARLARRSSLALSLVPSAASAPPAASSMTTLITATTTGVAGPRSLPSRHRIPFMTPLVPFTGEISTGGRLRLTNLRATGLRVGAVGGERAALDPRQPADRAHDGRLDLHRVRVGEVDRVLEVDVTG